jgi:hypothetical protein
VRQFIFKLALALGKTVEEVLSMSSREFIEWKIYFKWNLTPQDAENARHCIMCDLIAKCFGNKRARPSDFMPSSGFPKIQSIEEQKSALFGKKND